MRARGGARFGYRGLLALFVLCLSLHLAQGHARAGEPSEYTEAVNLGLSEFDEKNFREARVHFARAHAIYPSARTLRALGMVHFELKNYGESARFLRDALASRERPLEDDKRQQTEKLLARALGYIARLTLDIASDTQVTVDGKVSGLAAGSELVLPVGEHALEFRAPGRVSDKRTLIIEGGEHETLRVRLAELSVSPANDSLAEGTHKERPVYKSPWLWTALGVVVVGAAVGTAIALTRDSGSKTEAVYPGTGGAPPLMGLSQ